MALSEAKKKANKKWDDSNKEQMKYLRYRSYTKTFITTLANQEDLQILKDLIKEKEKNFKKSIDKTLN
jgi:hypothetical protein